MGADVCSVSGKKLIQQLSSTITGAFVVGFDGCQGGSDVVADELLVVDADDAELLRDGDPKLATDRKDVLGVLVRKGEQAARLFQRLEPDGQLVFVNAVEVAVREAKIGRATEFSDSPFEGRAADPGVAQNHLHFVFRGGVEDHAEIGEVAVAEPVQLVCGRASDQDVVAVDRRARTVRKTRLDVLEQHIGNTMECKRPDGVGMAGEDRVRTEVLCERPERRGIALDLELENGQSDFLRA